VIVSAVPWARHGSRFTSDFEDTSLSRFPCKPRVTGQLAGDDQLVSGIQGVALGEQELQEHQCNSDQGSVGPMTELAAGELVDLDALDGGEAAAPLPVRAAGLDALDEQLIAQLAGRARASGLALTGEGGVNIQPGP